MGICKCPLDATLPSIENAGCPQNLGQIQKVIFARTDVHIFAQQTEPKDLAAWTAQLTADDNTKVVVSPYLQAPTAEGGAARTFGGGNDTLGGIEMIVGREPTAFSAVIRSVRQEVIKQMKELECYGDSGILGVYLVNENGKIICLKNTVGSATHYDAIPIRSFFVGDLTLGGYETPDSNAVSWSFLPNWSDNLHVIENTFNALTDLNN